MRFCDVHKHFLVLLQEQICAEKKRIQGIPLTVPDHARAEILETFGYPSKLDEMESFFRQYHAWLREEFMGYDIGLQQTDGKEKRHQQLQEFPFLKN
jgi:hypothetical protein